MRPLDYEWAKPVESLSLISQDCAVWLYMAEPFRLMDYCSLLKANRPLFVVRCLKKLVDLLSCSMLPFALYH